MASAVVPLPRRPRNRPDEFRRDEVSCGGEVALTDQALQEMFAGKVDAEFAHGVETTAKDEVLEEWQRYSVAAELT